MRVFSDKNNIKKLFLPLVRATSLVELVPLRFAAACIAHVDVFRSIQKHTHPVHLLRTSDTHEHDRAIAGDSVFPKAANTAKPAFYITLAL